MGVGFISGLLFGIATMGCALYPAGVWGLLYLPAFVFGGIGIAIEQGLFKS